MFYIFLLLVLGVIAFMGFFVVVSTGFHKKVAEKTNKFIEKI